MTNDLHVKIAELQEDIEKHIGGLQSNSIIFQHEELDGKAVLNLITVNPRHRQSFLFHSVDGYDKIDCLKKMMKYVKNYKEEACSYTIQWSLKGESELNTSYFRAANILDALDKLYYGRDMNSVTVFSVVLNPIS